jgi:hypothetical protein
MGAGSWAAAPTILVSLGKNLALEFKEMGSLKLCYKKE